MFKKIIPYLPSFIWMIFIFYLSGRSTIGIGQTRLERFLILKTYHLIEYAVLFILFYLATQKIKKSALLAYFYALSDEIHQSFIPGREAKFADTLIDLLGIFIGFLLLPLFFRLKSVIKRLILIR